MNKLLAKYYNHAHMRALHMRSVYIHLMTKPAWAMHAQRIKVCMCIIIIIKHARTSCINEAY